jgi:hypothetical protein
MQHASLCSWQDMDALDVQGIAFESSGSSVPQSLPRIVPTVRLLLPAASKGAVELDQRQRLALLCSYQGELCRKQIRVRCQYFKIAR